MRDEISRLFEAGPESQLVIRIHGEADASGADTQATLREMLQSLSMYGAPLFADALVEPPSRAVIARALLVLARPDLQRGVLDTALSTFGRKLIDPLGDLIDRPTDAGVGPRLSMMRDLFFAQLRDLRLSEESHQILAGDLGRLLTDEYLALLAEHEDRVQRPRARRLAQEILRLVARSFHAALARWPAHADPIAASIARRLPKRVRATEVPTLIRRQITEGIEEFLWVETSTEILGALRPLFAEHGGLTADAPAELDRAAYGEVAEACFGVVAEHC